MAMRRKHSGSQDHHQEIDGDDTPTKLRRSPPNSGMVRSRYEIDHGSSDWNNASGNVNGGSNGKPSSPSDNDGLIPPSSSPQHSPTAEGLFHRKKHFADTGSFPTQQLTLPDIKHPLPQRVSSYTTANATSNRKRGYSHGNSNKPVGASMWKRTAQCCFSLLLVGYLSFLYFAQSHYSNNQNMNMDGHLHQTHNHNDFARPNGRPKLKSKVTKHGIDHVDLGEVAHLPSDSHSVGNDNSAKQNQYQNAHNANKNTNQQNSNANANSNSPNANYNYAFKSSGKQHSKQQSYKEPSTPAYQRAFQWSKDPLTKANQARAERLRRRRQRTKPPAKQPSALPLWYKLDYSSGGTASSLQQRWADDNNNGKDKAETAAADASTYQLCGTHAKEASKHHPNNYLPPFPNDINQQPLGKNSRVMISGILTPLGLHLAIALHRQCNVTNILGLDTQMPNDPLSRLEQQERLAILMRELEDVKQLQVPFMGLEIKRDKKGQKKRREERVREAGLLEIRGLYSMGNDASFADDGTGARYDGPFRRYGIPLSPGTSSDGAGSLDVLLDYRPTHIVHLAGTQSDSLSNSNYHHAKTNIDGAHPQSSSSIGYGNNGPVFQNKEEEEEDILKETIGARPHLYDLRMGVTGMEQLLSGVVAQSMLPPRYGKEDEDGGHETSFATADLSPAEAIKMRRPHVVYASNYDALRFRDAADRLNRNDDPGTSTKKHKLKENDDDEEVLGSASRAPKPPPRGLHGASRLVDELLSASYRALYGISSVGLRFDAIYGPRGFGVPSASVPIFHVDRVKRRRGVSPDVDLSEVAVRSLYRGWMDGIKAREAEEEEGEKGDDLRKLGEERQLSLIEEAGWMHLAHDRRDFVFVEDAVGAIIAAMQYRAVDDSPTSFNIGSGEMSPLSSLSDEIQELATVTANDNNSGDGGFKKERTQRSLSKNNVIDVERSSAARDASLSSNDYLRWEAETSLKDGAAKLLAWHLDRALPFFPPASTDDSDDGEVDYSWSYPMGGDELSFSIPLDGEGILSKRGISSCSNHGDPTCLREAHTKLPCASECSTQSCIPSVFDSVVSVTHSATEDCDVVMYTMALGYDVEEMTIATEYSDGEEQEEWMETTVCTIAFVPSESTLVKEVIDQVSEHSLKRRGVSMDEFDDHDAKVKKLNGYLAHHGWVLILVDGATVPLTAEDMFLPKLSPARLFHSSVRKAMFVDENFSHTPYPDDAQFLASETSRGVLKKRTVMGPDAKGHKTKYKLPEEPQRRAVIVVSPMRHVPDEDGHKMPLKEVTWSMMKELGLDNPEEEEDSSENEEPRQIRTQREYYERSRSLINSFDLRSLDSVSRHRLEIKDFIRSRWIVHHLKLEEGHQYRCEWYREHIQWSTHLDQLSFAYVMAKRDLVRKILTRQPLVTEAEKEKMSILQQIIRIKSDAHEWHPIFSSKGGDAIHHSQIALEEIPVNLQDLPGNEVNEKLRPDSAFSDVGSTYYVRIMSDERMLESRKKWIKARNNHRRYVAEAKKRAQAEGNDE